MHGQLNTKVTAAITAHAAPFDVYRGFASFGFVFSDVIFQSAIFTLKTLVSIQVLEGYIISRSIY